MLAAIQALLATVLMFCLAFDTAAFRTEKPLSFETGLIFWLIFQTTLALLASIHKALMRCLLAVIGVLVVLSASTFSPLILLLVPGLLILATEAFFQSLKANPRYPIFAAALVALIPLFFLPQSLVPIYAGIDLVLLLLSLQHQQTQKKSHRDKERIEELEHALLVSRTDHTRLEHLIQAQEDSTRLKERAEISQKLHDTLGHTLTGTIMQLEAAELLLKEDTERVHSIIKRCSTTLKNGLEAIRAQLQAMKPTSSCLGQVELRAILERFGSEHGWQTRIESVGDLSRISQEAWTAILQNLNEALTNALRHSNGDLFSCELKVLNKIARITFLDNGSVSAQPHAGMGIEGMKTRMTAVNGSLTIDIRAGFSISMLVPLEGGACADTGTGRG